MLLADAIKRTLAVSDEIAIYAMVVDAIDTNAQRFYKQFENAGQTIGPLDLLIGAHALSQNLIVITNNVKEFSHIDRLIVENWV